jgi:hypothetical protein
MITFLNEMPIIDKEYEKRTFRLLQRLMHERGASGDARSAPSKGSAHPRANDTVTGRRRQLPSATTERKEETMQRLLEVVGQRITQVNPPPRPLIVGNEFDEGPPPEPLFMFHPICWEFLADEETDEEEECDH